LLEKDVWTLLKILLSLILFQALIFLFLPVSRQFVLLERLVFVTPLVIVVVLLFKCPSVNASTQISRLHAKVLLWILSP
jgi:hypothetical protein